MITDNPRHGGMQRDQHFEFFGHNPIRFDHDDVGTETAYETINAIIVDRVSDVRFMIKNVRQHAFDESGAVEQAAAQLIGSVTTFVRIWLFAMLQNKQNAGHKEFAFG